jgi:putative endonuclease
MASTRQRGAYWEQVAESYLNQKGLQTLERNYQARVGEIDLVMLDGRTLVFTEVRYRKSSRFGSGADSVTVVKQRRIIRAARRYLQLHPETEGRPCRFDVLSIGSGEREPRIDWIRDAFDTG